MLVAIIVQCYFYASVAQSDSLTNIQKKELTVFGLRSMGLNVGVAEVKKVLSIDEVEEMITTGLNLNGFLCARLTTIKPLRVKSTYEATCIAYEGGSSKKHYIINALEGVAFIP